VHELAKYNCKIILSSRNEIALKKVATTSKLLPENNFILPIDLEQNKDSDIWVSKIIERFKRVDIVINNGGFSQRSYAIDTNNSIERKLMEVDYFSYTAITKSLLPIFHKQGGGKIVVISSIAGKFGFYSRTTYSAAKHALHGYFDSLRLEEENNGISVLIVCPGKIQTNISNNAVLGDGSKHSIVDPSHKNAVSSDACAQQILNAIKRNKQEIYIGGKELLMVYFKQFLPALFRYLVRRVKRD